MQLLLLIWRKYCRIFLIQFKFFGVIFDGGSLGNVLIMFHHKRSGDTLWSAEDVAALITIMPIVS